MKQIKIKKEFWDKIVSGEKKYEFRKLSKGLTTGTYEFVSISETIDDTLHVSYPKEIFGTATLTLVVINPKFQLSHGTWIVHEGKFLETDFESWKFVKENYMLEGIDFIAYQISEVK